MAPPLDRRRFLEILGATGLVLQGSILGLPLAGCKEGADDSGDSDERFWFAVITDLHIKADPEHHNREVLAQTLGILEDFEPPVSFVLISGDLVDDLPSDDPAYYEEHDDTALHVLEAELAASAVPCHVVMGNHDYYDEGGGLENSLTADMPGREQLFVQRLGMPAPWHSFDHQGVRFIGLSSMQQDPEASWTPGECGSFGPEQLAWLEAQLADGAPCFLYFHHPLATDVMVEACAAMFYPFEVPRAEGGYDKYEGTEYEGWTDPIYAILEAHAEQVMAIFVGHGHWWVEDRFAGIPVMQGDSVGNSPLQTSVGEDEQEQPMRYHLVEVNLTRGSFAIHNRAWIPYEG